MDELPIYESRRHAKGLWQRYLVFRDRVELRTFFGRFRIKMSDIEEISVSPSIAALIRDKKMGQARELREIKLDSADFAEHVSLRTKGGLLRSFRFTPDDPAEFVYSVQSARRHYPQLVERLRESEKVEWPGPRT